LRSASLSLILLGGLRRITLCRRQRRPNVAYSMESLVPAGLGTPQPHAEPTRFDFGPMMMACAGHYTVGFVALAEDRALSRGSGTLVRFGNIAGVLTCAHVLEEVLKKPEIGILCFPTRATEAQKLKVERDKTQHILIGSEPWSECGPDLAFLRLPDAVMPDVERLASVLDGMRHRASALQGEPDPEHRVELVCGVVDERTKPPVIKGEVSVTPFEGLMNVGRVVEKSEAHGMDLYRFLPVPGECTILPESYEGSSGGGLWRIYTKSEDNGTYSLVQSRLAGVAFWEKPVEKELHIICHGQHSIYNVLYNQIKQKWWA
jgi:hypothetical protein